jgi:hypothetical protein
LSCFLGVIRRALLSKVGIENRRDIVAGCNERLDAKFLRYAWTFNKKHRKGILKGLSGYPNVKLVVLNRREDADRFLREMEASRV